MQKAAAIPKDFLSKQQKGKIKVAIG